MLIYNDISIRKIVSIKQDFPFVNLKSYLIQFLNEQLFCKYINIPSVVNQYNFPVLMFFCFLFAPNRLDIQAIARVAKRVYRLLSCGCSKLSASKLKQMEWIFASDRLFTSSLFCMPVSFINCFFSWSENCRVDYFRCRIRCLAVCW